MRVALALVVLVLVPGEAHADLLGHDLLRAHVDEMFAGVDVAKLDERRREELVAPRLSLMVSTLVPGWGTYRIERKVFGSLRPAGVVFDWIVGGAAPATLAVIAVASDDARTRSICAWTAAGLYVSTRVAIQIIGNLHISAYNEAVRVHLGVAGTASGDGGGALVAVGTW